MTIEETGAYTIVLSLVVVCLCVSSCFDSYFQSKREDCNCEDEE